MKKLDHDCPDEVPCSALSPIDVESPLERVPTEKENKNSLEEPSVNNEDSPQNFSTIEKNESIWFMAEAGSSPEAIANHDDEELASNNAYTSNITHSEVHGDSMIIKNQVTMKIRSALMHNVLPWAIQFKHFLLIAALFLPILALQTSHHLQHQNPMYL